MRKKHSWFKSIDNRRKGKKRQIDNRRKGKKRQEEKKYLRINVKYFSIAWIILYVITFFGIGDYFIDMISSNPHINPTQNIFVLNFVDLRSFVYISFSMFFGSFMYGLFNVESKDTLKEQIKLILLLLTIVFLPILYTIHKEKQNYLLLNEEGITYHVEDGLFCAGKHVEIAWDSIYSVGYFIKFPNSKHKEHFIRVDYSNRIPQKTEYLEIYESSFNTKYLDFMDKLAKRKLNKSSGDIITETYSTLYTISAACENMETAEITHDSIAKIVDVFWYDDDKLGYMYIIDGKRYFKYENERNRCRNIYKTKEYLEDPNNYYELESDDVKISTYKVYKDGVPNIRVSALKPSLTYKEYKNGVCYTRKMKSGVDPTFGVK